MKIPSRVLASLTLALCSTAAHARDDFQQWTSVSASIEASDRVQVSSEVLARFSDNRNGLYEIEASLLVGYKLTDKITAWAGYLHNPQYTAGNFRIMEHRAREQVTIDKIASIGRASLGARLRFEQRWRDGIDGTAWRMRPYVKLGIPLGGKNAPSINLSEEVFVNLKNTSFQSSEGVDRLRTAASLSIPVGGNVKLETGYLNQHRFVQNGADIDEHVLTAAVGVKF